LEYATRGGGILNAHTTITPMKAVQIVEAAGIEDAPTIIADFAAAGLVKGYALATETVDARGVRTCVRGAKVPVEFWQRATMDGVDVDVWTSGTFRLAGSDLVGGAPAAVVTGITFNAKHIDWLIAHHDGVTVSRRRKRKASVAPTEDAQQATEAVADVNADRQGASRARRQPDPAAISPAALVATMKETEAMLGVCRGTVYNLIDRGKLVRVKGTSLRSVKIEAASVRALAGSST